MGKLSSKGRIDRRIYTRFRNILTQQIRDSKAAYFNTKFDRCKNNIRNTCKIIDNTTKKQKLSRQTINYKNENVVKTENVPNKFIDYFINIA